MACVAGEILGRSLDRRLRAVALQVTHGVPPSLRVEVKGQLLVNNAPQKVRAALAGLGLACVPEDYARLHLKRGDLVEALGDWAKTHAGFHRYYPSRRQPTPAFSLLVEALRYRA
ncbi:MAG: hypothetical protein IT516_08405 [Burkholderiales bacterium]|nr:hypothetical protein [Burkholderiales bacterium]